MPPFEFFLAVHFLYSTLYPSHSAFLPGSLEDYSGPAYYDFFLVSRPFCLCPAMLERM